LVDSGGQYVDGTTDVTRTVPIGKATQEMCERYTLVLQGHIALATIRFPAGTTGSNLDAIARYPLWQAGLDYDHGTGHGVGAFLGVHEGPQRISKTPNAVALQAGMIVSNEPGFYKTGEYGIRIENLQYVTDAKDIKGGERPMHGFHTLTLAPFCRALIETDMLTRVERDYVDAYHARVLEEIGPELDDEIAKWLKHACRPL
jgi:Xaa-Pro aminopeptidase